ncbi:hypothetical protein [Nostoc sp.]|uniref:hypothetical protein n=1 Tax=Nostoc sp. TaxID=1180 RepID=UPI002FF4B366
MGRLFFERDEKPTLTPVASSRETLSAVPLGGFPLGASLSLWEKTGLSHHGAGSP